MARDSDKPEVGPRGENLLPRHVDPKETGPGVSRNDDALYSRGGCRRCGRGNVYFDGLCVACFEYMGGDGPGRDSMG